MSTTWKIPNGNQLLISSTPGHQVGSSLQSLRLLHIMFILMQHLLSVISSPRVLVEGEGHLDSKNFFLFYIEGTSGKTRSISSESNAVKGNGLILNLRNIMPSLPLESLLVLIYLYPHLRTWLTEAACKVNVFHVVVARILRCYENKNFLFTAKISKDVLNIARGHDWISVGLFPSCSNPLPNDPLGSSE